jgi:hypothetical protein
MPTKPISKMFNLLGFYGAPCGIRTHGPRIRNPVLYPSELRGRAD